MTTRTAAKTVFETQINRADQLDNVDPAVAVLMTESGSSSEDKVSVSKTSIKATALKPSQTTMVLEKAVGMAIGMLVSGKIGGDLGALISSDDHIMDGHHRWAATIIAAGSKGNVGGYVASLPGKDLLKVLNVISKGAFGVRGGQPGKGSITQFTPDNTREILERSVEQGVRGDSPISADKFKEALEKKFGSIEEGVDTMSNNVKLMHKSVPNWAPDRAQMPVITPHQVPAAANLLSSGDVDWNAPFKKASNRNLLIRLASVLPKGSKDRRIVLKALL